VYKTKLCRQSGVVSREVSSEVISEVLSEVLTEVLSEVTRDIHYITLRLACQISTNIKVAMFLLKLPETYHSLGE
jgi:hypothetical protein